MEIEFSHVTYFGKSKSKYKKMDDISFTIKNSSINGIVTNYDCGIVDILSFDKKINDGIIKFDNIILEKGSKFDNKELCKNIGIVKYYLRNRFIMSTVREELLEKAKKFDIYYDIEKKIEEVIKIVGLSCDILDKNPNYISATQKNKLSFAMALIHNPKVLVFDNFELGLTFKEKENFKKLLRVLKIRYKKTIVLISGDMDFLKSIVDFYVVIENGLKVIETNSCYNSDIYEAVEMPPLINFIKFVRCEGHNIEEYVDIKELIKGIYRDVTSKDG